MARLFSIRQQHLGSLLRILELIELASSGCHGENDANCKLKTLAQRSTTVEERARRIQLGLDQDAKDLGARDPRSTVHDVQAKYHVPLGADGGAWLGPAYCSKRATAAEAPLDEAQERYHFDISKAHTHGAYQHSEAA